MIVTVSGFAPVESIVIVLPTTRPATLGDLHVRRAHRAGCGRERRRGRGAIRTRRTKEQEKTLRIALRFGGGVLNRSLNGFLTAGQDGRDSFPTVVDFAIDLPARFSVTLDRRSLPGLRSPAFAREYHYHQASAFLQDTFRLTPRWTLNLGVRYAPSGAPINTGETKDGLLALGQGASPPEKLRTASLVFPSTGSEPLYNASRRDWSARAGFAHDLRGDARTVILGAGVSFMGCSSTTCGRMRATII